MWVWVSLASSNLEYKRRRETFSFDKFGARSKSLRLSVLHATSDGIFLMSQGRRLALNSPGIFSFIARACPSVIGSVFSRSRLSFLLCTFLPYGGRLRYIRQRPAGLSDGCRRRLSDVKVFFCLLKAFFPTTTTRRGRRCS